MSDSGFVPPREWHWSAWLLLIGAILLGLAIGFWTARVQYRLELDSEKQKIAEQQQTVALGEQVGSVNEDITLKQSFQADYRELQKSDIETRAVELYEEKLLDYDASRLTELQLMQSEAEEAYVVGHWTDANTGAVSLYRRILQYEPDNEIAKERLVSMARRFLDRSTEFEDKGDLSAALGYAQSSLEVLPSEETAERISELSQRIAIEELKGQAQNSAAASNLANAKQTLESGSSDIDALKQSVSQVENYRNGLGIRYSEGWILQSGRNLRKRGLALIESDPNSGTGYELLQLASALDGKTTAIPRRKVSSNANIPANGTVLPVVPEGQVTTQETAAAPSPARGDFVQGYNHYIGGSYGIARTDFEAAAENSNDPRAQFYLALIYSEGSGVRRDTARSQQYLAQSTAAIRTSLDRNESWAQFAQGVMYEKGWLVQQNNERALNSYTIAAQSGDIEAQYRLGRLMQTVGGTRAGRTGAEWIALAKANGHTAN